MRNTKPTILYFGSFNPVHIGHLAIANYIVEFTEADSVWFIVTPQNPLKTSKGLLPDHHRVAMLQQTVQGDTRFRVLDFEKLLPKPNYTINSLQYLQRQYPEKTFKLLVGGDNLAVFGQWYKIETILKDFGIWVYGRPGFDAVLPEGATLIQGPQLEISGTFIREALVQNKNIQYWMPNGVYEYLYENKLLEALIYLSENENSGI